MITPHTIFAAGLLLAAVVSPSPHSSRHRARNWHTRVRISTSQPTRLSSRRRLFSEPMRSANGRLTGNRSSSIPSPRMISKAWSSRWQHGQMTQHLGEHRTSIWPQVIFSMPMY